MVSEHIYFLDWWSRSNQALGQTLNKQKKWIHVSKSWNLFLLPILVSACSSGSEHQDMWLYEFQLMTTIWFVRELEAFHRAATMGLKLRGKGWNVAKVERNWFTDILDEPPRHRNGMTYFVNVRLIMPPPSRSVIAAAKYQVLIFHLTTLAWYGSWSLSMHAEGDGHIHSEGSQG